MVLSHHKKRSWSSTLGQNPFRRDGEGGVSAEPHPSGSGIGNNPAAPSQMVASGEMDMQSIVERYHSLALVHYDQTKRRRLESAARSQQNSQRLEMISTLQKKAQDVFNYCSRVLRSEEHTRRENERERREVEEEMRRAEREKALAEDFLRRFDQHADRGGEEQNELGSGGRIGGIPSRFLDLSHFPKLKKSAGKDGMFTPEEEEEEEAGKQMSRPIIDCTEEAGGTSSAAPHAWDDNGGISSSHLHPMRIPSFGIPQEVALTRTLQSKQNTKRIYLTDASLSHVNGTYIQEGSYNGAPLFVRVGPPRNFMGKWPCSVVLRREAVVPTPSKREKKRAKPGGSQPNSRKGTEVEYAWKIGLVPAHRIKHPRIIGYFIANEVPQHPKKRVSNIDRMEEDDEDDESYLEPPADGWRVFQDATVESGGSSNNLGRASSLKILCEE